MARLEIDCRRCNTKIVVDDAVPLPVDFPFCSERCRLIDLGKWADEEFRFKRAIEEADLDQGE